MSIHYPHIFSAVSHINLKSAVIFFLKVKKSVFFICIRIADFSLGMNNKRIIVQ